MIPPWCRYLGIAAATEPTPDVTLTGTMTGADHATYREVPFEMPAGVVRLTVEFSYTGRDEKTAIDLGLRDPIRWRVGVGVTRIGSCWRRRMRHRLTCRDRCPYGSLHSFELITDGPRHWLRADVRAADGKLLLLGNPIYFISK